MKDDPIEIEVNPATKFIKESDNLILDKNMIIGKKSKERLSGSKKFTKVSSIHIAQFAKSDNHTIQGTILWQAFYGIMSKWESPHRVYSLDCKKEMISYYARYGFKVIGHNNLLKRYIMIKKKDTARYNN